MEVINAIRDRIAAVAGVSILHVTSDVSHNRSVITFVAPAEVMPDAAFAAIRAARDRIDLSGHAGVHPRIGAADVVPFVPLDGATMEDCIAIARAVGERVGRELEIPVYLYERAATRPAMRNLANVRRGGFEGLQAAIQTNPDRTPDFGPSRMHPSFGAVAIGARPFLVAFNVYIGGADAMPIAREVARAVRESSGGLPCIKALALEVDSQAQVSMNLVDIERTPLSVAFDAVERETRARGGDVTWSEIIGLVPERVGFEVASHRLRLRDSLADHVLERRILQQRETGYTLRDYVVAVAGSDPFPGGGSVAAIAGVLAAVLTRMIATLTL
ncbi:MAG: glutamate formimidoyltransferase [Gemmatimonadaceae bacterium]